MSRLRNSICWTGLGFVLGLWLACTPPPQESPRAPEPRAPRLFEGLGDLHHPITTSSPLAQRYFDQGLVLTYGFNHEAAVRSFEAALEADPNCAMCAWGVALALGPNINAPMGPEAAARAFEALQRAQRLATHASPRERAYIEALSPRYSARAPAERAELDRAYAEAMGALHAADPDDLDAATLYAEALMDLSPWNYWTSEAEPREHTDAILERLEAVLRADPNHVGANHYYIHAVEEHYPERAVPAAERLGDLAPDAGHLVHMPSHIFWRVGRYDEALEINRRASASDERFFATCGAGPFYRSLYYPHNVHFLWAAAAASGRGSLALATARKLEGATAADVEELPFLQEFQSIPLLTLARFGHWDPLLGQPQPPASQLYVVGIWHYARGLAQLRTGDAAAARSSLDALDSIARDPAAETLVLAGGVASAAELLAVGSAHLRGEIGVATGESEAGLRDLQRAVEQQDALAYMEPPPWYFPTRQALGAALLELERPAEAEAVYRRDLEQHPSNGWSLFGLAESLRSLGNTSEATWAARGFRNAWEGADVELERSAF